MLAAWPHAVLLGLPALPSPSCRQVAGPFGPPIPWESGVGIRPPWQPGRINPNACTTWSRLADLRRADWMLQQLARACPQGRAKDGKLRSPGRGRQVPSRAHPSARSPSGPAPRTCSHHAPCAMFSRGSTAPGAGVSGRLRFSQEATKLKRLASLCKLWPSQKQARMGASPVSGNGGIR